WDKSSGCMWSVPSLLLQTANEAHGRTKDVLREVGRIGRAFGNEKEPVVARRHCRYPISQSRRRVNVERISGQHGRGSVGQRPALGALGEQRQRLPVTADD